MAAPITSSDDWADGICCPETFWSGCRTFPDATACLPQATSWALLEYQMLIGPVALILLFVEVNAGPELVAAPPPPPHAARTKLIVTAPAANFRACFMFPPSDHRGAFHGIHPSAKEEAV